VEKINAFILAAGYGERLRPITDYIPKPLLPLLGKPVIEIVLERLARLPVDSIGINAHHKSEALKQWLDSSQYADKIEFFHEKTILGTGGALKNAEKFLSGSAFIVHNADILSDISLDRLIEEHFLSGNIATLAVHDYEKFNNILVDSAGIFKNMVQSEVALPSGLCKVAFTGIAVYSRDFLGFLPEGNSSVVAAWLKAQVSGKKIGTVDFSDCSWTDIGTPAAYAAAVFETLGKSGETIYVHSTSDCSKAEIEGYAAIESGCVIKAGTYLNNCILLPEADLPAGSEIEDAVVGPDYIIRFAKPKGQPADFRSDILERFFGKPLKYLESRLIGTGGSDRKYYRFNDTEKSAVLMVCSLDDPDFERHIEYTEFFRRHYLPVPEMFSADKAQKQALFEDLGDISLYSWLKCRREPEVTEYIFSKVLDILVTLHTSVSRKKAECWLLCSRVFDYEHLRWETSYFLERFVTGIAGIAIRDELKLQAELRMLAESVDSFPKAIVHRDFQAQNIMIERDGTPRLIDFQGARVGPPAYDLASVLWDPYFRLEDDMRERLVCSYIKKMRAALLDDFDREFDEEAFRHSLQLCRLQRHMQALGAYGFLSKVKGKKYFLKHIPQAMEYLVQETALANKDYPALHELVKKLNSLYAEQN
jgi:NDP-sugar pyrophosphorylase family protein/aminoglycoside/choline kinase family phosphotransferase